MSVKTKRYCLKNTLDMNQLYNNLMWNSMRIDSSVMDKEKTVSVRDGR